MITAIIRNKENTLVLDLPHSIYDIYEKLRSIGIVQPPKQIPLTDNEDEDIGVKLFSDNDFGNHLLLTLSEDNSLADANLLTYIVQNASEDIKEALEQDILYDQYGSMNEVVAAVRQMTQDAGPILSSMNTSRPSSLTTGCLTKSSRVSRWTTANSLPSSSSAALH